MKRSVFSVALVCLLLSSPSLAKPRERGLCGDLKHATPGLYGLCIAYHSVAECEPDFSQVDPVAHCAPSSRAVLGNYQVLMEPTDPVMPGVQPPPSCLCWSEDAVSYLVAPGNAENACVLDSTFAYLSEFTLPHSCDGLPPEEPCEHYASLSARYADGVYTCRIGNWDYLPGLERIYPPRTLELTEEEYQVCRDGLLQQMTVGGWPIYCGE